MSPLSPRDRIIQRLAQYGVPKEHLDHLQRGLVAFIKGNKSKLHDIFRAILPSDEDVSEALVDYEEKKKEGTSGLSLKEYYSESILWLQWIMFEDEPQLSLKNLAPMGVGQHGVCRASWHIKGLAYRCKTCERSRKCVICIPCFRGGDHDGHDFSFSYTDNECCDCGDETTLKRDGFCSKHVGPEHIQPLPEHISRTVEPVLRMLFTFWEHTLLSASGTRNDDQLKILNDFTSTIVEMLLEFFKYSGSILTFVCGVAISVNLLSKLVTAESFLDKSVSKKLHELLLKLLGDPLFKYEFAKSFVTHYVTFIMQGIAYPGGSDYGRYFWLPTLSVQMFSEPTLATRLVKEANLVGVLFSGLRLLFGSCGGEGDMQVNECARVCPTILRVLKDICRVMSHVEVVTYLSHNQPNIFGNWMRIVAFMQGMHPQKRVTDLQVKNETNLEVEDELIFSQSFITLEFYIEKIHSIWVNSIVEESDTLRKISKCLTAMDNWLARNVPSVCLSPSHKVSTNVEQELGLLCLPEWPIIPYDVSFQEVSLHIPLHRTLSILLLTTLKNYHVESEEREMRNFGNAWPGNGNDFLNQLIRGCHPIGFSAFIMEHPLQIKVFDAQIHCGMWQRNELRPSVDGLELDIFLLQFCAALSSPDLFVKRILERFGLLNYLSTNLEQSNKYEPALVQDMLTFIIQIVKERRFCGLSISESLRRELVYKLAIADATRSQLLGSLPEDLSENDQLQTVLDEVAEYSSPFLMEQGKYSLRKSCWGELDLYHLRWNSRDLQRAEERYLRFCKVSALSVQLPRWTKVFHSLSGISRIATSRTLLEIVHAVFFYAASMDKQIQSRAPEGVVLVALHLVSLGLDICNQQMQTIDQSSMKNTSDNTKVDPIPLLALATKKIKSCSLLSLLVSLMKMHKKETLEDEQCNISSLILNLLKNFAQLDVRCMKEIQQLAPEISHLSSHPCLHAGVYSLEPTSDAEERKLKAREKQVAILENMRAAQSMFMESFDPKERDDVDVSKSKEILDPDHVLEESAPVVCSFCKDPKSKSPLCFLILLQKSRLVSFVERGPLSWKQVHRSDKEHSSIQKEEMSDPCGKKICSSNLETGSTSELEQLLQDAVDEFSNEALPGEMIALLDFIKAHFPGARDIRRPLTTLETLEIDIYQSIQKDMQGDLELSAIVGDGDKNSTKHGEEGLKKNKCAESTLLGSYIASLSRVSSIPQVSKTTQSENESLDSVTDIPFLVGPIDCDGIHISSCGHVVHQECYNSYMSSLDGRSESSDSDDGHVADPGKGELLCPVCRRLANSVSPSFPSDSSNVGKPMMLSITCPEPATSSSGTNILRVAEAITLLQNAGNVIGKSGNKRSFALHHSKGMQPTSEHLFYKLSKMYFPDNHEKFLASGRVSHCMMLWKTLKYSLISLEITARGLNCNISTGSSKSGLEALYKELESSAGFILSVLLRVIQNRLSENSLEVLQRFRGIQLFAGSICCGVSLDEMSLGTGYRKGNISSVLKYIDGGIIYPDVEYWNRAGDPVIAHDAFASLMWVLFSLPSPFLSCEDSFRCLVHLFYTVCVVQAIITYSSKYKLDIAEMGFGDCLISDINHYVGDSAFTRQYFASNYSDDFLVHPRDAIRRLSYPYLRRCALLWKVLKSSIVTPSFDTSCKRSWLSSTMKNDILELMEVEELEHMFHIPDLDFILKDKKIRTLALKWLSHFCRDCEGHSYHSTPAAPFTLMRLPHIYQDLLERYNMHKCRECGSTVKEPALCLLCGRVCSRHLSPCCEDYTRETCCRNHAASCGAGFGVYLLIRESTILLQIDQSQKNWPSLYLDVFGEEDVGICRGKPLFLNEERYAYLTNTIASHGLYRSFEVLSSHPR